MPFVKFKLLSKCCQRLYRAILLHERRGRRMRGEKKDKEKRKGWGGGGGGGGGD